MPAVDRADEHVIEAHHLTKRYGETVAVNDLTFTVRPGVVTGFLGPNGAGKSTTMRMILGLDAPTSGTVTVNGRAFSEHENPLREVGALLEARSVHPGRSARNHLLAMAATAGIGDGRADEVIDMVGLSDVAKRRVGAFSLGMGQRVGIASALLADRDILLLDEPVDGLDPDGVRWIRNLLKGFADEGRTVFVGAATGMVAIALVVAYNTRHLSRSLQLDDIVASAPMQGYYLGQLLIGSLGVLFVSGEYSTGMIRSTLAAVPKRIPVLWAKLTVFVVITAVTIIPISVVAFISAEGLISHFRTGFSLSDPGVLRVVIGTGVYLTLIGVIGATVGWLVRSTPGALVTYFALILVVPVLFGNVLGNWGKNIAQFLPSEAGRSFVSTIREPYSVTPWAGLALLFGWVLLGLVAATLTLGRRDA
jgi:ABC-2 type transport system permease protein